MSGKKYLGDEDPRIEKSQSNFKSYGLLCLNNILLCLNNICIEDYWYLWTAAVIHSALIYPQRNDYLFYGW